VSSVLPCGRDAIVSAFPRRVLCPCVSITLLQVAANPYVSILGPPQTAASRLNLTQALNSLGTTIAPVIGSILILSAASLTATEFGQLSADRQVAYKIAEASSVQIPYLAFMGTFFSHCGRLRHHQTSCDRGKHNNECKWQFLRHRTQKCVGL